MFLLEAMLGWRNLDIHNRFPFWKGQNHYNAFQLQSLHPCSSCFRIQFTLMAQTWMSLSKRYSAQSTAHYHCAIEVHLRQYATSSQGQSGQASSFHSTPFYPWTQAFAQLSLFGPWSTAASNLWSTIPVCSLLSASTQSYYLRHFCPYSQVFTRELTQLLLILWFNVTTDFIEPNFSRNAFRETDFSRDRYRG